MAVFCRYTAETPLNPTMPAQMPAPATLASTMSDSLSVSLGQYSHRGRKDLNQDFHGAYVPNEPLLSSKGIAIALADGISSSKVSQIASEAAVTGFLEDYFCTPESWSVKKSARCVITATNSWLYSQTRQSQYRYDKDRGYVCTMSAMVIKSNTAHLFHVGDARIYRLRHGTLEPLTNDHRMWISQEKSYLSRALGINPQLEIDYLSLQLEQGEVFVLATDGVYEFAPSSFIVSAIVEQSENLDMAAKSIADEALRLGSDDNLTVQILRVDDLPKQSANELYRQLTELPLPPLLCERMLFDGFRIMREIHVSSRSHVYLAVDEDTQAQVVLKTPSIDLQGDASYLERFMMEEWIARRISSPHVVRAWAQSRKRNYLYTVTEYIEGRTLTQWMIDNPRPDLEWVRSIIEQIAKGLRAFHRLEMLHQDLRPENVIIDAAGNVKIVDFGSTRVAGLEDIGAVDINATLGTAQYTAPEYFLGEGGSARSDIFSLGVIAYQMLTARLPYGTAVAKARTRSAQNRLKYRTALDDDREIPPWLDCVIKKAVHPNPLRRFEDLSEFVFNLRKPGKEFVNSAERPLIERNPVLFWQCVSFVLMAMIAILLLK